MVGVWELSWSYLVVSGWDIERSLVIFGRVGRLWFKAWEISGRIWPCLVVLGRGFGRFLVAAVESCSG